MTGNYSEERCKSIKELENVIQYKLDLIESTKCQIMQLRQDINNFRESLDADYEKLLELDPCLMR